MVRTVGRNAGLIPWVRLGVDHTYFDLIITNQLDTSNYAGTNQLMIYTCFEWSKYPTPRVSDPVSSRYLDPPPSGRLRLGRNHLQDAILQVGRDIKLGQRPGKGKLARKVANLPLLLQEANRPAPAVVLLFGLLLLLLCLCVVFFAFSGCAALLGAVVAALGMASYQELVCVAELNVDVLAVDAGQLAVEFIGFLGLADVEFGIEAAAVPTVAGWRSLFLFLALHLARVAVEVVEQPEEGGEVWVCRVQIFWETEDHVGQIGMTVTSEVGLLCVSLFSMSELG